MRTFISILLIGLVGFLGCSDSNDGINTFTGEAIPVAPFGIIDTPTPTYGWIAVPWATRYRLIVQDMNQESAIQNTQEAAIIDEWYTAEEAGCASEGGLCMVTPDIEVIGEHHFKVQACANEECGLWSDSLNFDFAGDSKTPRFTDNGDGTVTDNRTQLMWTKNASPCEMKNLQEAIAYCGDFVLAKYSDWRLPDIHEMMNLTDYKPACYVRDTPPQDCSLPGDVPFVEVQTGGQNYWTVTPPKYYPETYGYQVNIWNRDHCSCPNWMPKTYRAYVWPVRTGK